SPPPQAAATRATVMAMTNRKVILRIGDLPQEFASSYPEMVQAEVSVTLRSSATEGSGEGLRPRCPRFFA
ncbi:MAG: hypothetical protein V3V35_06085, partial [Dehalococcoidia bacterium]